MRTQFPVKISEDFKPDHSLYGWASREGIPFAFIDDLVNSFIYYWSQQGKKRKDWDQTFVNHVKNRWSNKKQREKSTTKTSPQAYSDWQAPKIDVSKSKKTLKQRLREAG